MNATLAPPTPETQVDGPPSPPAVMAGTTVAQPAGWALHWRGLVFHESMLTGQHLATLALLTGTDDYEALDLDPRHGHQRLMQMLTAFLIVEETSGLDDPAASASAIGKVIEQVSKASADEILGALRFS